MFIAIAVAVVALAVAIGSWFRPTSEPTPVAAPTYTDSEVADAKKQVCDAYQMAHEAIVTAGGKQDPADAMAYAANGRLAFFAGGQYLYDVLTTNPATPTEMAESARTYATNYRKLALVLLADKTAQDLGKATADDADAADEKLKQLCQ
ncbi:MAG: hypothetical protein HYZ38_12915 [Mycobacterium sp.]|nr:hypothetical protein [Mycobacterium sp.]